MNLIRYSYPHYRLASSALTRSPWAGLEGEISRLFENAFSDYSAAVPPTRFPVDLYEDKANTYVRAELPGVNRDDINVEVTDGALTIAATRKVPAGHGEGEQSIAINRVLSLGEDVQSDKVAAAYENGVLTVTLPKREQAQPKKIAVAVK
ncbi:MAG: Hsp20/alpha crystallin family protein [Opitutaceae bacterium]|nr:Hsp20/alpha crystallin family protein [Opitutaceae bacterium]